MARTKVRGGRRNVQERGESSQARQPHEEPVVTQEPVLTQEHDEPASILRVRPFDHRSMKALTNVRIILSQ